MTVNHLECRILAGKIFIGTYTSRSGEGKIEAGVETIRWDTEGVDLHSTNRQTLRQIVNWLRRQVARNFFSLRNSVLSTHRVGHKSIRRCHHDNYFMMECDLMMECMNIKTQTLDKYAFRAQILSDQNVF